ncbi:MAG: hypothetical protein R3C05_32010 [Pirellulaceae bacterium]
MTQPSVLTAAACGMRIALNASVFLAAFGLVAFLRHESLRAAQPDVNRVLIAQSESPASAVDDEGERMAEALVDQHLPELKPVLASLKKHSNKEYRKAMTDLARTSRRLQSLQKRDETGYEIEVAYVQWQTRADLALAELAIRDTPKTRDQLKQALINREQVRMDRMNHERSRLIQRIDRMQEQVLRLDQQIKESQSETVAQQAFDQATRRLKQNQTQSKKKTKPLSNK